MDIFWVMFLAAAAAAFALEYVNRYGSAATAADRKSNASGNREFMAFRWVQCEGVSASSVHGSLMGGRGSCPCWRMLAGGTAAGVGWAPPCMPQLLQRSTCLHPNAHPLPRSTNYLAVYSLMMGE